jgi:hypothetical protein
VSTNGHPSLTAEDLSRIAADEALNVGVGYALALLGDLVEEHPRAA